MRRWSTLTCLILSLIAPVLLVFFASRQLSSLDCRDLPGHHFDQLFSNFLAHAALGYVNAAGPIHIVRKGTRSCAFACIQCRILIKQFEDLNAEREKILATVMLRRGN